MFKRICQMKIKHNINVQKVHTTYLVLWITRRKFLTNCRSEFNLRPLITSEHIV